MCKPFLRSPSYYGIPIVALMLLAQAALAADAGQYKVVDGIAIYWGVLPAEIIRGHVQEHPKSAMHGGVPPGEGYHHVIIALYDSQSRDRITDAEVTAKVEEVGHLAPSGKQLEPMTVAGTVTYANYFKMPVKGPYRISLQIRRPGSPRVIEAQFEYRHP